MEPVPLSTGPSRRLVATVVALVAALLSVAAPGGPVADAQSEGDARTQREQVRAQRAQVAAEVDVLEADADQIAQSLADLQADVATQRAALSNAEQALASAQAELGRLDAEIAATEAEMGALRDELRRYAVVAYVQPPGSDGFGALDARTAEESANKRMFLELRGRDGADVVDRLRGAAARLDEQRRDAEQVRAEAEAHRAEVASRAQAVEASYARQAEVNARIESRLNARLAESQSLASLDTQLSQQIAAEEAAVAARLAAARQRQAEEVARRQAEQAAAEEAARQRQAAQAAQAAAATPSTSQLPDGTTSTSADAAPTTTAAPEPQGPVTPPPIVGAGELATVGGITVHRSIAGNLQGLLGAAAASGITLTGTGWRDSSQQVQLRMQHCGSSAYAIYQMSPDACRPPTAVPGRSKHEQGLAVDFACNGQIIQSRSSACFQWLAANAGSYGFINLPSEPWHWSNDGS